MSAPYDAELLADFHRQVEEQFRKCYIEHAYNRETGPGGASRECALLLQAARKLKKIQDVADSSRK